MTLVVQCNASGQRAHLSRAVHKYENPDETVRGSTTLNCTWVKRAGQSMKPRSSIGMTTEVRD